MTDTIFECVAVGTGARLPPDQHWMPPNPGRPTQAQPGTRQKSNVMIDRLERGEPLFHPRDRNCFDEGGPC